MYEAQKGLMAVSAVAGVVAGLSAPPAMALSGLLFSLLPPIPDPPAVPPILEDLPGILPANLPDGAIPNFVLELPLPIPNNHGSAVQLLACVLEARHASSNSANNTNYVIGEGVDSTDNGAVEYVYAHNNPVPPPIGLPSANLAGFRVAPNGDLEKMGVFVARGLPNTGFGASAL